LFDICFQAEADLRQAQAEFDRQAEITKLLLEGITSTHVNIVFIPLFVDKMLLKCSKSNHSKSFEAGGHWPLWWR